MTDVLPAAEALASPPSGTNWACSGTTTVTCTYSLAIADGASAPPISLPVKIPASATGTITNTAAVAPGPTDDPVMSDNSGSDEATVLTSADLNIGKTLTAPAGGLVSGDQATYTVNVNNLGPSDAVAPQVQDVLPAGESFVSASGTDWACQDVTGTVTCSYTAAGTLSEGESASPITLVVSVSSADVASITNTAIVCSGTIGTGPTHAPARSTPTAPRTRSPPTTPRRLRAARPSAPT